MDFVWGRLVAVHDPDGFGRCGVDILALFLDDLLGLVAFDPGVQVLADDCLDCFEGGKLGFRGWGKVRELLGQGYPLGDSVLQSAAEAAARARRDSKIWRGMFVFCLFVTTTNVCPAIVPCFLW